MLLPEPAQYLQTIPVVSAPREWLPRYIAAC
jgi:hypothetical protein